MDARRNWIAVASAEHVAIGRAGGFMQVCHGKAWPLRRLSAGDRVVYYSPVEVFGTRQLCRSFTAVGEVQARAAYQVEMGPGFLPYRRDVRWWPAQRVAISHLVNELEFSRAQRHWAASLRFGLCQISSHDMDLIIAAMAAQPCLPSPEASRAEIQQYALPW